MQITGDKAVKAYNKYVGGYSKFKVYVVSSDYGYNAYSNYYYNSEGTSCSFRKANATPVKAVKRHKKGKEVVIVSNDKQEVDNNSKSVAGSFTTSVSTVPPPPSLP